MAFIIGVDIGTSGSKAIAYQPSGQVIASAYRGYEASSRREGYHELDPQTLLDAVTDCIAEVAARQSGLNKLLGISFSCAMHSLMAVDGRGMPLTAVITWADLRSKAYAKHLRDSEAGQLVYARTGTPIHPMSPLCKIMWLRQEEPEIFQRTSRFISIKEYIWHHMFGQYCIDYSIASATGLFDIYTCQWFPDALRLAGIGLEQLSQPVPPEYLQYLPEGILTSRMGLAAGTACIIGANDGCLANLGTGAVVSGTMALTIGTSAAVRMVTRQPKVDPRGRIFNYILQDSYYVCGGAVNNGGNALHWYVDQFMNKPGIDAADFGSLVHEAVTIEPGSGGLIFLPYLQGERAPVWDADARAVFFGMQSAHTPSHFLRSVMEGISYSLYQIGRMLEEAAGPAQIIRASGGFIQSPFWIQMMADIFNKPVQVSGTADASAVGAAMLGLYSLGMISSLEQSVEMTDLQLTYFPNLANHRIYMKYVAIFDGLYTKLKDDFDLLHQT